MSSDVEQQVLRLFARVTEALARATWALLSADVDLGRSVVDEDREIDDQVSATEEALWRELDAPIGSPAEIRQLVRLLFALSELERSADLAEHIAQRAVFGLGGEMTPVSRGIVQRMSEVAIDMWRGAAEQYASGAPGTVDLGETDEELDILHDRLTSEVATGSMQAPVAAQVTLLARFYERLGDHAVNLSRRLVPPDAPPAAPRET
ncbi:MAG TPA: PhoU domain-containing protein [Acidimicrobiales bacterium]|nr:PhoU domain-containing protein [Acidimicrobiales bacterium]